MATTPHPVGLGRAQTLILQQVHTTPPQWLGLEEAVGRVGAQTVRARRPCPAFSQASRDGFAVRAQNLRPDQETRLAIVAEVAAGNPPPRRLRPQTAVRVMTGAALPAGTNRVLAREDCHEEEKGAWLRVPPSTCAAPTWIRPKGGDLAAGRVILRQGQRLGLGHLPFLADNGLTEILVHQRPLVYFFCTGSELRNEAAGLLPGQKISANRFLLAALIRQYGGLALDLGLAADTPAAITSAWRRCQEDLSQRGQPQAMIISTGGLGPGKFDLTTQTFVALGGRIVYHGLRARPGKSTLFGVLGNLLFFALPGPPAAIPSLFHTLVGPALNRAQGLPQRRPPLVTALLEEAMAGRQGNVAHLREGRLSLRDGQVLVRPTRPLEEANAVILLPGNRAHFSPGEKVGCYLNPA